MILLEDFDFNKSTLTCKTMEFYGSDKGTVAAGKGWHNYTIVYNKLFSNRFYETLRICSAQQLKDPDLHSLSFSARGTLKSKGA